MSPAVALNLLAAYAELVSTQDRICGLFVRRIGEADSRKKVPAEAKHVACVGDLEAYGETALEATLALADVTVATLRLESLRLHRRSEDLAILVQAAVGGSS